MMLRSCYRQGCMMAAMICLLLPLSMVAQTDTLSVDRLATRVIDQAEAGNMRQAHKTLDQAQLLAESLADPDTLLRVELTRADLLLMENMADSAKTLLEHIRTTYSGVRLGADYFNLLGTAHQFTGSYTAALQAYRQAFSMLDTVNSKRSAAGLKLNQAAVFKEMGNMPSAFQNYLEALEYAEQSEDSVFLATTLNNIGETYNTQDEPDRSSYYLQRSLDLSRTINYPLGELRATLNLANARKDQGRMDEAEVLYNRAHELSAIVRPDTPPVRITYNQGMLYRDLGQLDRAEELFREALGYSRQMNVLQGEFYNYTGLGDVARARGNLEQSVRWYSQALQIARNLGSMPFIQQSTRALYELRKRQGQTGEALSYLEELTVIEDSLAEISKNRALAEYESRLGVRRTEQINQLLREQQKQQQRQLSFQKWLIAATTVIIVLTVVFLALLYSENRNKRLANRKLERQKQELEEVNAVKNKLFAVIAHDLRSPISSMKGTLELFRRDTLSKEQLKELSSGLELSLQKNIDFMQNLLAWARSQMEGISIDLEAIAVREVLEEVRKSQEFTARNKGIELKESISAGVRVMADYNALKLVLRNLINNAIKYTPEGGMVEISSEQQNGKAVVKVSDNGYGIPADQQDKIFSQKLVKRNKGRSDTGFGLSLCKEFVERMNGEIRFESTEGEGTAFYVTLPAAD